MPDGVERFVDMQGDARTPLRNRWKTIEDVILSSGASVVECLNKKGDILRTKALSELEEIRAQTTATGAREAYENEERRRVAAVANDRRELAALYDAMARHHIAAFHAGRDAAATSHEALTTLVSELTGHLTMAITNLHNVSVNLANVVTQAATEGGGDNPNGALLGAVLTRALGGGTGEPSAPNGKKGGKS